MRVLLLTLEAPLDTTAVCTGNQVRADHLKRGLEHHGHSVTQWWHSSETAESTFGNAQALADRLRDHAFDTIIAGYWELVEWLPDPVQVPLVIDCVAPRPLEYHYEQPEDTVAYLQRMQSVLQRADLIVCGNQRQRHLMLGWTLQAGLDLRRRTPILVAPLSCDPRALSDAAPRTVPDDQWNLVSGGLHWPWRQLQHWLTSLVDMPGTTPVVVQYRTPADQPLPDGVQRSPMLPFGAWQRFLREQAHIGLELADHNLEREFSQSFRAMACLEAGLPVLLNEYLELAGPVQRCGAGWPVTTPPQARTCLQAIIDGPDQWLRACAGARELAAQLDFRSVFGPLATWLDDPQPASRLVEPKSTRPAATADPEPHRGRWLRGLIGSVLTRPFRKPVRGHGVVVVTRSDLVPADHGAAVKIMETARALHNLGRPVAIVTADRHRYWTFADGQVETAPLPLWLRWLAPPGALTHAWHLMKGWPASNAFLYWALWDPFYALRAAWVGRRIGAAIYLAEFPGYVRACLWARKLNDGHVVLVEHNVEYRRIQEQSAQLSKKQFDLLKHWEISLARACDAVICVSRDDQQRLRVDGVDADRLLVIPHGVDVAALATATPADVVSRYGLDPALPIVVYHGTYSYAPNAEAMRLMATEILPRLKRAGCPVQVLAVGSRPLPGLMHPHIHFTGSVAALGPVLSAAHIAAVPLVQGGGTRMKILDYFAAGLPVVCTEKGCEGIPVTDGVELLIRDDWDDFAAAIIDLLEHEHKRKVLSQAARQFVDQLDWPVIGKRYDELVRALTGNQAV